MPTALSTRTNIGAIRAHRQVSNANREIHKSTGHLASGLRLVSAADDVAGMAVSTSLRAQLGGFRQAMRNTNNGISMIQTAEAAYGTIADNLSRMRELAVQASSDGLTNKERAYIQTEFQEIQAEIDRVSAVTEYNGINLLTGSAGSNADGALVFQVGMRDSEDDRINVTLKKIDTGASSLNVATATTKVDSLAAAQSAISRVDLALDQLSADRTVLGSKLNKLTDAATNLASSVENASAAESYIRDVDMAAESTQYAAVQVLQQAGVSMISASKQVGAVALQLLG